MYSSRPLKLQKGTNYFGDEGAGSNRIINNEAGHVQRQLKQIFDYLLIKIYGNATMFNTRNTEQGSYNGNHKRLMKGQT